MEYRNTHLFYWLLLVLGLCYACKHHVDNSVAAVDAEQLFAFQVYPLLESKCFNCHGDDPKEIEGAFDMRTKKGMLKGGESGKLALVPNHPDQSPIYLAAKRIDEDFAMPPKENDRLDQDQLDALQQWIAGGAPWPDENRRKEIVAAGGWDFKGKVAVETSGGLNDSWTNRTYNAEDIWAFYPIKDIEVPQLENENFNNPIDAFIHEKLDKYNLRPAPKADKRTLIRRATFDLTGLPPTKEAIDQFIEDDSEEAFEKLVDRLLDSPRYGEQWARHWLDVVRYADSDGFANDYMRPNAWRYRDYVIRAFNEDKPYNQFVLEQIAGDELNPNDSEHLIATGFLRMGPWEHTGMSVEAETRQYYLDDISNSIGEVFLSQPLRCARCHDHKFDPIPTKDVYRVQAVFATTQFAERPATFLEQENLSLFPKEKRRILDALETAKAEQDSITAKEEEAVRKWFAERGKKYLPKKVRRKLPDDQQPPRYLGLTLDELGYRKLLQKRIQRLNKERLAFDTLAYSVYNGPPRVQHSARMMKLPEKMEGAPADTYILTGGSVYAKGENVKPGALSVLAFLQSPKTEVVDKTSLDFNMPSTMNNRRLAFAKWVTHPDNPLFSRSIVNRIWQYHFGQAIAGNANNFGVSGKKPTHPKLLDWMAQYFIKNGWSIKQLHKLIMLSETYQRSSTHPNPTQLKNNDPNNQYLAVFNPRPLAAEEIRDAILFSTGELNTEIGGLPVRPEIHMEVALQPRHVMGSIAPAYQPSPTKAERNRRTIYTLRLRGLSDPMLEVFNRPGSELSCEQRTTSTVTPQVFMLFNDQNIRKRGVALADHLTKVYKNEEEWIEQLFIAIYNRLPSNKEKKLAKNYLLKMTEYHQDNQMPKEGYPKTVEREMFEEMTGETFHFTEKLSVYDNYERDKTMSNIDPPTRALTDLAVVLFNSNEFMYIY